MAWLSPAYPVGAFSYSSGIEWAVESGRHHAMPRRCSAGSTVIVAEGGGFCDAVFSCMRIARSRASDDKALRDGRRTCRRASRRRRSAIWKQPRKAARSSRRRAPHGRAPRSTGLPRSGTARSPIRSRSASRRRDMASRSSLRLRAYLHARHGQPRSRPACGSFRSARPTASACSRRSSRSSPRPRARALATPLDEVGGAAFRADIASMRHETQYTRLFRS